MATIRPDRVVDLLQYTEAPGGAPASTADPFDPYLKWWTRRAADVPCFAEALSGSLRDFIFGDREGEFWRLFLDRGALAPRPDTDLARRWLLRQESPDLCWLVDFAPKLFDPPLAHLEVFGLLLSPTPANAD